jgi:hypothetical protein
MLQCSAETPVPMRVSVFESGFEKSGNEQDQGHSVVLILQSMPCCFYLMHAISRMIDETRISGYQPVISFLRSLTLPAIDSPALCCKNPVVEEYRSNTQVGSSFCWAADRYLSRSHFIRGLKSVLLYGRVLFFRLLKLYSIKSR